MFESDSASSPGVRRKRLTLLLAVSMLALGMGLVFTPYIQALETGFFQQLLELSPAMKSVELLPHPDIPRALHLALVLLVGIFSVWCRLFSGCREASIFVVIPLLAGMLMSEILAAVMLQIWLPMLWPMLFFCLITLVFLLQDKLPLLQQLRSRNPVCSVAIIEQYRLQGEYRTALSLLKHCPFSDEMFELAYEFGMELEDHQRWVLARELYQWLAQFDPGIEDFVERIDSLIEEGGGGAGQIPGKASGNKLFGHYELLGGRAAGATSTVYEARDLKTHQRVALKILNSSLDDEAGAQAASIFLHEAQTASELDHPNIVRIHDADVLAKRAYIAMDFITGHPMSVKLRRKELLSTAEALRILTQVLDALAVAHKAGIVHGDIKPANIMFDQARQHYILTDFGAAYSQIRARDEPRKIIGTPAYMSPEQLRGLRLDGRSDLFSLAVTMIHLISGAQPFTGDSLLEISRNVKKQEPDLTRLPVVSCLRLILEKALEKKSYRRYADAEQMLRAVNRCAEQTRRANSDRG